MRRLIEVRNSHHATELVRRLNDASLTAIYTDTPPVGEGDLPMGRWVIWIGEDDDVALAAAIIDEFRAHIEASTGATCNGCGYDLRAHADTGRCPECGRPFRRGTSMESEPPPQHDITCSTCGEEVPASFESCWNCGRAMD